MSSTANQTVPRPRLRWFQFSLRTLFVFMTVAGCGFGWLGIKVRQAIQQRDAVEAIAKDVEIFYDYQIDAQGDIHESTLPSQPIWLRKLVGAWMFDDVAFMGINTDQQMELIQHFPRLTSVQFYCFEGITDAGLAHLKDAPQIQRLEFGIDPNVTDAGMIYLRDLRQLQYLDIQHLQITDAGLEHLKCLTQLKKLKLSQGNRITAEGVRKLQAALPKCEIVW